MTINQLSEKITSALPPGQEESQKERLGWWQFWK
jgi:hypothetical protein